MRSISIRHSSFFILHYSFLQYGFHPVLLGDKAAALVKLFGALVAGPDVQGQVIAADLFRVPFDVLVKGPPDMLPADLLVDAEVVDIEGLDVGEDIVVRVLLEDAEA